LQSVFLILCVYILAFPYSSVMTETKPRKWSIPLSPSLYQLAQQAPGVIILDKANGNRSYMRPTGEANVGAQDTIDLHCGTATAPLSTKRTVLGAHVENLGTRLSDLLRKGYLPVSVGASGYVPAYTRAYEAAERWVKSVVVDLKPVY
jgi:hypothetical protein